MVAWVATFVAARVGDGFLVTAAAFLCDRFGTGDLGAIFDAPSPPPPTASPLGSVELAAACFGVAAILKSAQFPTHGWLVEIMDTPTPRFRLLVSVGRRSTSPARQRVGSAGVRSTPRWKDASGRLLSAATEVSALLGW